MHIKESKPTMHSAWACVGVLVQFYDLPFNAQQLLHELAADSLAQPARDQLLLGFRKLSLKAGILEIKSWEDLANTPLPAMALLQSGEWIIVAKAAPDKVLIHNPMSDKPEVLTREAFEKIFSGTLLLATRRAGIASALRHFDVRWFIPEIWKHRKLFGEVVGASLLIQIFALITPLFFQVVVDKVLVHNSLSTLNVLVVGLIALALFEAATGGLRAYVLAHTTSRIDVTLGARLFDHLLRLPLSYFQVRRIGDTVARVRELETIRNFLTGSTLMAVLDALFVVVFLAVMLLYSVKLTLVVVLAIPLYVLLCVLVAPVLRARVEEKFARSADSQAFLVEAVNGIETIKASAIEPQLRRRWEEQLAAYVQASFKAVNLGNTAGQVAQLISKLTTAIVLWWGAHLVMGNELTVGMLVAFNMLSSQVTNPILRLAQLWQEFQQVGVSVERLGDVLNTRAELASGGVSNLPQMQGSVAFEHVTFRYQPDTAAVLENLSLTIKPGEVVGLVGPSGSGKSTLTKLVQRLYLPERGRVLIDGMDMARYDPAWLRRQIGVVLQENFLFHRTIRENIALAVPGLAFEEVVKAAELAGAHEFIVKLPDGYETVVGERGCTLSGGQRQRLAIARALVANPRLLIMDEATSALDYESESIIQANMAIICKGRTVIIIAHRLSAVRHADRILVLEQGRLTEEGNHTDLLKRKGTYAKLHQLQLGGMASSVRPKSRPRLAANGV